MKIGLYQFNEALGNRELKATEDRYGTALSLISVYRAWNNCSIHDDHGWLQNLRRAERDMMITWEPWSILGTSSASVHQSRFSLKSIVSGIYDQYITDFGRALADFPVKVMLRPMHEMNGNWYPWCGTLNGNRPEQYIGAWRHIRKLIDAEARVAWVWSPYVASYPESEQNVLEAYFPGDGAVDWIALDGYNWGTSEVWSRWQSFEEIFRPAYQKVLSMSGRPVMIGETACSEEGGHKGQWITEAAEAMRHQFSEITSLVWFDMKKECDWRVDSSPESLAAFRALGDCRS